MLRSRAGWIALGLFGGLVLAGSVGWGAAGFPVPGQGGHMGAMGGGHCAGCHGGAAGDATPPDDHTIVMQGSAFHPPTLTIRVGESVSWVNRDGYAHTVTSDEGSELASGDMDEGDTYRHTFREAGTFEYHCEPHAYADASGDYRGMVARIVVR